MSRPFQAGKFRHRVNVEQSTEGAADSYGETTKTWAASHRNVPAWIQILSGEEAVRAVQVYPEARVKITTRYIDSMSPAYRLVSGSRIFNVVAPVEDERRTILEWFCVEARD